MNMEQWLQEQIQAKQKRAMPLLSYPSVQLMFINVEELVQDPRCQALGMKLIADRYDMPFSQSYMDLSVEAEAFGAECHHADNEVPTIVGKLIETQEEADALVVPEIGAGRTGKVIEGIKKALVLINDRPVFANCIGPFSLAGRLLDVNEALLLTIMDPDLVHTVLKKCSEFILKYVKALKATGCQGVVMSEPLAGLLSSDLMQEFSSDYVKSIISEVQDENFIVCYHNCSNAIETKKDQLPGIGAKMYHFGNNADMPALLESMPKDRIIMGNISPAAVFRADTSEKMAVETQALLMKCFMYDNFMISSGCDVPWDTPLANADMFFDVVELGYRKVRYWSQIDD